ncbi:DUF4133 domain-containing protein [Kaistella yonginensis]|uniref:DUF4133 domain-containing protein n=1 Tax=Kaistella yonginensis TaxID=658267 RepID=UPI0025B2FE43|nr:DUF4133 domain-containing protein [Kaistella yonginensis]MDN3607241.1 DUF4133 domain-containing protein [Kaistella yonginensis]
MKKPLVFFGLKDKYIYYAMGSAVGGFMTVAILSSLIGGWGLLVGAAVGGIGIWWSYKMQDINGLHNKTKNDNELHVISVQIKNTKILQKK